MGSEFVDWKSTVSFVIPAQSLARTRSGAGIQVFFGLPLNETTSRAGI